MTWGAIGGAAIGVVGSALTSGGGSSSNGGAGTTTASKEPWAAAQPWIMNNLMQGQTLQNAYTAQPFSALQNQAYQNQNNQSAYMHGLVPNLLGQISGQQVGFDRNNPNARPTAFNFGAADAAGQQAQASAPQGLGLLNMAPATLNLNANTPQIQQPAPAQQGTFVDQGNNQFTANRTADNPMGVTMGVGSYGTFKYGDPMPQPGTQQYYDYQQYKLHGGADPAHLYDGGVSNMWGTTANGYGNSGNSVGGSPAADGSGGGNPGVY